jgi:DNA-binding ferritin-like protein
MTHAGATADVGSDRSPAILAGLNRIVADCVVLRYVAQLACWRLPPDDAGEIAGLLRRLISLLDDTAWHGAARIRALGESPEADLAALVQLSSYASGADEAASTLSIAALAVAGDFRTLETRALNSGDEVTAHLLFTTGSVLEESARRLWLAAWQPSGADPTKCCSSSVA